MTHTITLTRPIAFFDLETTGVNPMSDRIVEIAILKRMPNGSSRQLSHRVNPEMPIPSGATAVHGITDADVALEPTFRQLAVKVAEFLSGCDLSGYNVRRFDLPLLRKEFERCGLALDISGVHVVDVQTIFHMKEPRDLRAALRYYCNREHTGAHGALADVVATVDIFTAQLARYAELPRDIAELEILLHPKDPTWVDEDGKVIWQDGVAVFSFGKHRGVALCEVLQKNPDYLEWIVQGEFPEATKAIIREALLGRFPKQP